MMKKLFTSLLLLGVALCSWGQASTTSTSLSSDGKTLTVVYDAAIPTDLEGLKTYIKGKLNLTEFPTTVETLKLTGAFTNGDFAKDAKVHKLVEVCSKPNAPIILDLSSCSDLVSKVKYTGTGKKDWTSKNFEYVYGETTEKDVTKGTLYFENGKLYDGSHGEGGNLLTDTQNNKKYYSLWFDGDNEYDESHGTIDQLDTDANTGKKYYEAMYDVTKGCEFTSDPNSLEGPDDTGNKYYSTWLAGSKTKEQYNTWDPEYAFLSAVEGKSEQELAQLTTINFNGECQVNWNIQYTQCTISYYGGSQTCTLTKQKFYVEENHKFYLKEERHYLDAEEDWYYVDSGNTYIVDESCVTVPDANQPNVGVAAIPVGGGTAFTIAKEYGERLKGIYFPNGTNFTAIPDNLCNVDNCPNLESVVWGDQLEWIGKNAFKGAIKKDGQRGAYSKLAYVNGNTTKGKVTFPSTLKVISIDAFYGCKEFTEVDLNLPYLVKVDAAAFNMVDDNQNKLTKVTLPTSTNTTLKFWGNQVFSSSHITELNFRYCEGITNFAYDTQNAMGEGTWENPDQSGAPAVCTFYWHQYLENLILPPNLAYISGGDANSSIVKECTSLTRLEFTGRGEYGENCNLTNGLIIPKMAFAYSDSQLDGYTPIQVTVGGATSKLSSLQNVILSDNIIRINEQAFSNTSIKSIAIPASVQEIEKHAFSECRLLTTVIFDDIREDCDCDPYPTVIKGDTGQGQGAFNNCNAVSDVYINTSALLRCENNAFDASNTWGRGDAGKDFATLHFPIENIDNYVNLKHALTDMEATDPDLFHDWLMEHYKQAGIPYQNGWYEFINSGPSKGTTDPGTQEIILSTFSDWNYSYLVPDGLRAYVVNHIGTDANGNYELTLQRIVAIPAKTGVILYGHPNGKTQAGKPTLSLTPVAFAKKDDVVTVGGKTYKLEYDQGAPLSRDNWTTLQQRDPEDFAKFKNFLEPTSSPTPADVTKLENEIQSIQNKINETTDSEEKSKLQKQLATVQAEKSYLEALMAAHPEWKNGENGEYKGGKYIKPFENLENENPFKVVPSETNVAYRNFGMSRYSKTKNLSKSDDGKLQDGDDDYEAFFRLIAGYYPSGKAYLRLKADEYTEKTGAEILVKKDDGTTPYYYEVNGGNSTVGGVSPGDFYDARQISALNPDGWWNPDHGFDWEIAEQEFEYKDDANIKAKRMNWGKRPSRFQPNPSLPNHAPIYLGELGEDADGIVKLVIPANLISDGEYYTLQGVKVNNPTKGVYIRNGKKVIIK